ncbi:hypothetical protein IFM89_009628 [Coptis chinensis]|uniref:Plastid lipid-associated protein/fibrillin conserved domain-containing protein n=1 Tax=Coptis chinensis TaxID=261450 RepID=A0A835IV19_9MAGN|nr:hypothetical protein IFM89_009628 [Coptis chinensis]
MALFFSPHSSSLVIQNPKPPLHNLPRHPNLSLSFSSNSLISIPKLSSSFRINSSSDSDSESPKIVDEWGEKTEPEPEPETSYTKFSDADPPKDEDEWGEGGGGVEEVKEFKEDDTGNGTALYDKLGDLKRCLVDTFYGTELGFNASPEVRGEVLELVNQLELFNPTPDTTSAPELDGNWVLLYTAFSELLPLLAAGTIPLLKIKSICQSIDTKNLKIENSTTLSSPFATFSFSASATFEVRSSSRIQVKFEEGIFSPPEISSSLSLPENLDIFGQRIDLSPVQRSFNPLQDTLANISRVVSGQPPLKVRIPGERSSSWLLTTYLDNDFRISRGDGGLFILAKEGSPLLDQ